MMIARTHLLLLLLLIGCASAAPKTETRAKSTTQPTVTLTQISEVINLQNAARDPLGIGQQSSAPVDYRLEVTNPFDHPLTLQAVEVETVGASGGYLMRRLRHSFAKTIAPQSTATIEFRAWVEPLQLSDSGQIASPVTLRGVARFDSLGKPLRTAFTAHIRR